MDLGRTLNEINDLLESSNVNLGRKTAKTRREFIDKIMSMVSSALEYKWGDKKPQNPRTAPLSDEKVLCIKPTDPSVKQRLSQKGGYVMTKGDSQRADERIGNNPMG